MHETFIKVRDILPEQLRRKAIWLFFMMTLMGLMETVGVVSIVPFMMVVANPQVLHEDGVLGRLYDVSGAGTESHFLFLLGLAVFAVLLLGNGIKALTTWMIQRFTFMTGHELSTRLVAAYLGQPYAYFLTRHSADLGKNVLAEVHQVVTGVIQPGMTALARCSVACFMSVLLLAADPVLAVAVVTVLGGAYGLLYRVIRRYLSRIGHERFSANRQRYHVTVEAFSGVKEIKLRGLESIYCARFAKPSRRYAEHQAASQALANLPRYGLEMIAVGGVLMIILYLLTSRQGLAGALPLIALYAFAGYRMLPTLQEIFASLAKVRFTQPALNLLHRDLAEKSVTAPVRSSIAPLPFAQDIRLEGISYRYPITDRPVLHDLDLTIARGTRVGIVGPTGSGKSTLIDLTLGLLQPTAGRVLIDGRPLDSEDAIRGWQRQIGYVPQHIFLADDTVAANIAFGQPGAEVEQAQVERATRMAQLHDFIVHELPQGYDTPVGERGIRLSGGQRQRLGLARALYGDPSVLVLDEATSALDTATEDAVMAALAGVGQDCTVIMISHRTSTLRGCDLLVELEKGRIVKGGRFDEVLSQTAPALR